MRLLILVQGILSLVLTLSAGVAVGQAPEDFLDQLRPGVFTVCKVALDSSDEFPFAVRAEGPGVGSGSLVPDPVLRNGDCVDVYVAPS